MESLPPHHIKAARALCGMTQADLATDTGLTRRTIKFAEGGKMTSKTRDKITAAITEWGVWFEKRKDVVRLCYRL